MVAAYCFWYSIVHLVTYQQRDSQTQLEMPKRIKLLIALFIVQVVLYLMLYQMVPIAVCYLMVAFSAVLNFRDHLRTIIFIN